MFTQECQDNSTLENKDILIKEKNILLLTSNLTLMQSGGGSDI